MLLPCFVVGVASGFPIFFSLFCAFFVIVFLLPLLLSCKKKRAIGIGGQGEGRSFLRFFLLDNLTVEFLPYSS